VEVLTLEQEGVGNSGFVTDDASESVSHFLG
jgi:hypothetical protein